MTGPSLHAIDSALATDLSPSLRAYLNGMRAWAVAGAPATPAQRRALQDHLERTAVELGGPIPERFTHLQYLNEPSATVQKDNPPESP